jgi:hypothetical protein
MNASNASFDPMDWYKKLTTCLATKKSCKINLSRVPGGKEIKENKRLPSRISNHHLQSKFLAKYNEKRQHQDSEGVHNVVVPPPKPTGLGFNLHQNDQNGKRQKPDENYINLPPTYFKPNVPDLSIFKVPNVPQAKRPRMEMASRDILNNFTLESLFSGNFKPPKASTPIEVPAPIISDPGDILNAINATRLDRIEANLENSHTINQDDSKLKGFLALVDTVSKKIEATCFSKIADPLLEIINRLNETHDIATQSPRSSLCGNSSVVHEMTPSVSCRPVPHFYDHQENEDKTELGEFDSLFNKTFRSVSIFPSSSRAKDNEINDDVIASPTFNMNSSPIDFIFGTSSRTPSPVTIDNESILMTSRPTQHNEFNWLDEVFHNSMEFDSDDDPVADSPNISQNIFRSPPNRRSSKNELQRKFSKAVNSRDHDLSKNSSIWSNDVFDISLDL